MPGVVGILLISCSVPQKKSENQAKQGNFESGSREKATASHPFLGSWENQVCGDRKYKRQISLWKDFRFEGRDHLSPCPPEKKCFWSGIVTIRGTWSIEEDNIKLAITEKSPMGYDGSFVTMLHWNKIRIAERNEDGDCIYSTSMQDPGTIK